MNRLLLSLSITSALALSACGGGESISSIEQDAKNDQVAPETRVIFDPTAGDLSVPNDLLFLGSTDGSLNPPTDNPNDATDPFVAISSMDGWSTQQPFTLAVELPRGVSSLDASSAAEPGAIRMFEVATGGSEACPDVTRGAVCAVVAELEYGVHFASQLASANSIAVVPTSVLKPATDYLIAMTTQVKDDLQRSLAPSETYITVRQNITDAPLASPSQLSLQGLVNSFEGALSAAGVSTSEVVHTQVFKTQSAGTVLSSLKGVMAANPAAYPRVRDAVSVGLTTRDIFVAGQILPPETPSCAEVSAGISQLAPLAAQGLLDETQLAQLSQLGQVAVQCSAQVYQATIDIPYFSAVSSAADPTASLSMWWKAKCDSPVITSTLSELPAVPDERAINNAECQAINPAFFDFGLDAERNLTQYNPIPQASSVQSIPVQVTFPDPAMRALTTGAPIEAVSQPESGWPVVVLMHGILSKKEDMLAITGALSQAGFATVAIDMMLHGERGFDVDGDGQVDGSAGSADILATVAEPTDYMNLTNLQVLRDNLRQSIVDLLSLRLGIATASQVGLAEQAIDNNNVYYVGLSLGAMWGVDFIALANTPLAPEADPLFKIQAASLNSPGGGIANFLMDSASFGPFIKSSVILAGFEAYSNALVAQGLNPFSFDDETVIAARAAFITAAGFSATETLVFEAGEEYIKYLLAQGVDVTNLNSAVFAEHYPGFRAALATENPVHLAAVDGTLSQFVFAVQSMIDDVDPNNYTAAYRATNTPTLYTEIWGEGDPTKWDQVIPPLASRSPIAGGEPLAAMLGLPAITETTTSADGETPVSGFLRFDVGAHSSLLDPSSSAVLTTEMQTQIATFFGSNALTIPVEQTDLVGSR